MVEGEHSTRHDTGHVQTGLKQLVLETEYRSSKENPAENFYARCLRQSTIYKRAAGYFRSTVFAVVGIPLIEFSKRGGRTRLICSPELDPADIDSIVLGYAERNERITERLIQQIDELLASDRTSENTRILATLIAIGSLDVKLAIRSDRKGLYHEKIGVFGDASGNRVSFKGSANETWSGWHADGNFESIEVFCDWRGGLEFERVSRHDNHFDKLWSGTDDAVEVFAFPDVVTERLKNVAYKGIQHLTIERLKKVTSPRTALPHQLSAIESWKRNGCRGIFEHATGSGKTFTALVAVKDHASRGLPTLILVPSKLLLEQWADEVREEIPEAALLVAGGGHTRWQSSGRLEGMTAPDPLLGSRVVISTMQTASTQTFLSKLSSADHLFVVADEVHQTGSLQNQKIFTINASSRLGLSATPTRYGDPEGTKKIVEYFGDVVPPKISLTDAVAAGRLVPYEYFPHAVNLTAAEADEWKDYTRKIQLEFFKSSEGSNGRRVLSEKAKLLLIRRSRIAKKASAKIDLCLKTLKANFEDGQHWLVYCEDAHQLTQILQLLMASGLPVSEYHSSMQGDRDATLSWFKSYGGILVSIRCLDEGVDIPAISHGLILASSQNPRQFIQRRGRVLRRSPNKQIAVIHDAIVVPINARDEPEQAALLKSEMTRSLEFAANALNKGAGAELRAIAIAAGIDPDVYSESGVEEDE